MTAEPRPVAVPAPLAPARVTRSAALPSPRIAAFQRAALEWYEANGRDLAFRRTTDPWAVLVSEVMAQQTQAARAAAAWTTFIERYPTPAALAAASTADVIRAWRGLGYNRRAVALRVAAVRIVGEHGGRVPDSVEALEALPGIGPYTARAVLAIAFGRRVAALDTNIRRVLDRSLGPLPAPSRALQSSADGFVPAAHPAAWTHALMDIGATFCVQRSPRCGACPLASWCAFRRDGRGGGTSTERVATPAAAFESTSRWLRGRILDRLRDAPAASWVAFAGPMGGHGERAVERALTNLEREGFLELDPADLRLARLRP